MPTRRSVRPGPERPDPTAPCPCGLPRPLAACCGRFHAGEAAPTAELLMRSRYTAFAVGDTGYLLRSWHPSTRPAGLTLDPGERWQQLVVLASTGGSLLDRTGTVEFRASFLAGGQPGVVHETSRFDRDGQRWAYLEDL